MTLDWVIYLGGVVTLIGIAMLIRLILKANELRKGGAEPGTLEARLRRLIFLHGAAMGTAFFGLAIMVLGMTLS